MKLNFRNADRGVPLGSLEPGECFSHNSIANDAYMVCARTGDIEGNTEDEIIVVNLCNGELCCEDDSLTVYHVTVEGFVK